MGIPGALRPRSNTEILDAAFGLARRLGWQLLPLSLVLGLPISVFTLKFVRQTGTARFGASLLVWIVIVPLCETIRTWVLESAVIEAVLTERVSWPAVRKRLGAVFWRLLGSAVVLFLLCSLCWVPLVVPGVIFYLHRIFYSEVLLAEGAGVRSSFRRSFALTDGSMGRLGLLVLGGTLLMASLNWGFSLWGGKNLLGAALGWIGTACIALLKAAFYLLAYYDLRARREGVDLLARDAELESPAPTSPSPA